MSHLDGFIDEDETGDDQDDVVSCSSCAAEIYAGADRCPKCGEYVVAHAARPRESLPWWLFLGIVLTLAAIAGWIFG